MLFRTLRLAEYQHYRTDTVSCSKASLQIDSLHNDRFHLVPSPAPPKNKTTTKTHFFSQQLSLNKTWLRQTLTLRVPLYFAVIYTHARTHALHTHTRTHYTALTHTRTHARTHTHACTHYTTHMHAHPRKHARTQARTHTRTHARTHARTHSMRRSLHAHRGQTEQIQFLSLRRIVTAVPMSWPRPVNST